MKQLLLSTLLVALITGVCSACAAVMFRGERVAIADESALIIYDDETKTEHFIRRGTFETQVPYFGFIVPTPSLPELAEAPDDIYPLMEDWTKPEVITKTVKRQRDWGVATKMKSAMAEDAQVAGVAILGTAKVAGYEATILKASDEKLLREWLTKQNYHIPETLDSWLKHYIKQDWVFTAFQMKKPEAEKSANGLSPQAVRMSFKTDRPFYPYMEPEGQREPGAFKPARLLRVFYVGTSRVEGKLEDPKTPWPGRAVWSNSLKDEQRGTLLEKIKGEKLDAPKEMRLTVFEDRAAPRPGTSDLFFSRSEDQSTLARPPIIHYTYVDDDSIGGNPYKLAAIGGLILVALTAVVVILWRVFSRAA